MDKQIPPTSTLNSSIAEPPCSTSSSLSCPTSMPQLPIVDSWLYDLISAIVNVTITFEAGDKCEIEQISPVVSPTWAYLVVVNDDSYINYIVGAVTLDPGKTLADLQEYQRNYPANIDPPPFVKQVKFYNVYSPMSRTFEGVTLSGEPLYIACFVEGPSNEKIIEQYGPVELVP